MMWWIYMIYPMIIPTYIILVILAYILSTYHNSYTSCQVYYVFMHIHIILEGFIFVFCVCWWFSLYLTALEYSGRFIPLLDRLKMNSGYFCGSIFRLYPFSLFYWPNMLVGKIPSNIASLFDPPPLSNLFWCLIFP